MQIIAHRGASALEPENTIRSLKRAMELGVDMVEVDVRKTLDNELVIHHDPTLNRTTNGTGMLKNKKFSELHLLDAGQGEKIPTLTEVLKLVKSNLGLVIEIKEPGTEEQVLKLVRDEGMVNQVNFVSFYHVVSLHLKSLDQDICSGIIFIGQPIHPEIMAIDAQADLMFVQKSYVDIQMIRAAHDHNIKIYPWVVDRWQEYREMEQLGADGVVTNILFPSSVNR